MELLENPDPKSILNLDTLPNGYTYLLLILNKLNILNSSTIILSNIIFYAFGLLPLTLMMKNKSNKYLFLLLCCSSWVVQKHLLYPLSEALYIFISNWIIYLLYRAQKKQKLMMILVSLILIFIAFKIRTIGITLIPLLPISIILNSSIRERLRQIKPKHIFITSSVLLGLISVFIKFNLTNISRYFNDASTQVSEGIIATVVNNLKLHLSELGELVINLPKSQLLRIIDNPVAIDLFLIIVGFSILIVICWQLYIGIKEKSILHFYAIIYLAFVFAWPYYDPRFWVPLIPIIILILFESVSLFRKEIITIFLIGYITVGVIANLVFLKQSISEDALLNSLQEPTKSDYKNYFYSIEVTKHSNIRTYNNIEYVDIDFRYETVRLLKTY